MEDPLKNSRFINVIAGIGLLSGLMGLVLSFNEVMGPYAFVISLPAIFVCGLALYFDYKEQTRSLFAIATMGMSIICVAVTLYQHFSITAEQARIKERAKVEELEARELDSEIKNAKAEKREAGKIQEPLSVDHLAAMKASLETGAGQVSIGRTMAAELPAATAGNTNSNPPVDERKLLEYDRMLTQMQTELSAEKTAIEEIQAAGVTQENYEAIKNRIIAYNQKYAQFADTFEKFSKMLGNAQTAPGRMPSNAAAIAAGMPLNNPASGPKGLAATSGPAPSSPGGCAAKTGGQGTTPGCAAGSPGLN